MLILDFDWVPMPSAHGLGLSRLEGRGIKYFNTAPYHDEPKLFHLSAILGSQDEDARSENGVNYAGGSSLDFARAATKAVAEAVERGSAASPLDPAYRCAYKDLRAAGLEALNPLEFGIQKSLSVPSEDDIVTWVDGYRLKGREVIRCLIPQQLVTFPYFPEQPEPLWMQMTTSGLAAGPSLEGACCSAIAELAERHAMMGAWAYGAPFQKIRPENPGSSMSKLLKETENYQLAPIFYRLTTPGDLVTVMCLLRDDSGIGPWSSLGLKAGFDEEGCCLGALEEAHQLRPTLREMLKEPTPCSWPLRTIRDRGRWWLTEDAKALTSDFERNADPDLEWPSTPKTLGELIEALERDDLAVYVVPLRSDDEDVQVVRVVIPGVTQVYFDELAKVVQVGRLVPLRDPHPVL